MIDPIFVDCAFMQEINVKAALCQSILACGTVILQSCAYIYTHTHMSSVSSLNIQLYMFQPLKQGVKGNGIHCFLVLQSCKKPHGQWRSMGWQGKGIYFCHYLFTRALFFSMG